MIKAGKINDISEKYKQWFLGSFVEEEEFKTSDAKNFEIKWSKHKKGYSHPPKDEVVSEASCSSMVILVYGNCDYTFIDENGEYSKIMNISEEGDYVYWAPDINHSVKASEDTLLITIRWYK